jgi:hypothetical protein
VKELSATRVRVYNLDGKRIDNVTVIACIEPNLFYVHISNHVPHNACHHGAVLGHPEQGDFPNSQLRAEAETPRADEHLNSSQVTTHSENSGPNANSPNDPASDADASPTRSLGTTRTRSAGTPASFRTPIRISTAIAIRNARNGLSSAAAMMDKRAQAGKLLTPFMRAKH